MKDGTDDLRLYEELMLLALREKQGTYVSGGYYQQAAAGAVLAELLLDRCIELDGKKVRARECQPRGDVLLDDALDRIRRSRKERTLQDWLAHLATPASLLRRAVAGLCRRGILREERRKVLLFFTRKVYPEVDPEPEREVAARIRDAVLNEPLEVDPRTAVLVSLAHNTRLLGAVFTKAERKVHEKRIERISNGEAAGKAAKEAIEGMQAAIFLTCILPTLLTR